MAWVALAAAAVVAIRQISSAVKQGVQDANSYKDAMRGLNSVAESTGVSQAALDAATGKVVDQFINAAAAATAFKNLLLRGYSLDEATETILRLKDAAAFGRQASLIAFAGGYVRHGRFEERKLHSCGQRGRNQERCQDVGGVRKINRRCCGQHDPGTKNTRQSILGHPKGNRRNDRRYHQAAGLPVRQDGGCGKPGISAVHRVRRGHDPDAGRRYGAEDRFPRRADGHCGNLARV